MLPGDDVSAWKDVVVTRDGPLWRMWACEHLLDQGDDEADRMRSVYLTSDDGLRWTANGSRSGRPPDTWDRRGARITSAWESRRQVDRQLRRSGIGRGELVRTNRLRGRRRRRTTSSRWPGRSTGTAAPCGTSRSPAPRDGLRLYFEAERADGANDLRTVFVPFAA